MQHGMTRFPRDYFYIIDTIDPSAYGDNMQRVYARTDVKDTNGDNSSILDG